MLYFAQEGKSYTSVTKRKRRIAAISGCILRCCVNNYKHIVIFLRILVVCVTLCGAGLAKTVHTSRIESAFDNPW
jgi:hypothetical protein